MAERSPSPQRKIIHVDMDAFFASVEQRDHPELRGKPVVVGGSPERRGAIAAASYEARKYGIRSAMPSRRAAQLCRDLIFISPKMEKYKQISEQVRQIFERYSEWVEPVAFDEAYLDVTHHRMEYPSATAIARAIKQDIYQETQLTASAGVSVNKFLAKMASGLDKPDGLAIIKPEQAQEFVRSLPIEAFHGIGKVTARRMRSLNINTGADLYRWSEEALIEIFGKAGHYFYQIARGNDDRPVNPNRIRKSVGAERSFDPDISDRDVLLARLYELVLALEKRLQTAGKTGQGQTFILKLKYGDYQQITRSKTIADRYISIEQIYNTAQELFNINWEPGKSVRLLGLSISGFQSPAQSAQLMLPLETY